MLVSIIISNFIAMLFFLLFPLFLCYCDCCHRCCRRRRRRRPCCCCLMLLLMVLILIVTLEQIQRSFDYVDGYCYCAWDAIHAVTSSRCVPRRLFWGRSKSTFYRRYFTNDCSLFQVKCIYLSLLPPRVSKTPPALQLFQWFNVCSLFLFVYRFLLK